MRGRAVLLLPPEAATCCYRHVLPLPLPRASTAIAQLCGSRVPRRLARGRGVVRGGCRTVAVSAGSPLLKWSTEAALGAKKLAGIQPAVSCSGPRVPAQGHVRTQESTVKQRIRRYNSAKACMLLTVG